MKKVEAGKLIKKAAAIKRFGRVLFLFLILPVFAEAEVPVKFTYQGNLRQNGFLVNGQRAMTFRLYDSSSSASELWTSPEYNVNLSTGVFRVTLDPVISDWENGNLWLELEVNGNRMSPREELTSSPYAVNTLLHSGKRYTTAASSPTTSGLGDLWYDSSADTIKFWNGTSWTDTSGGGVPGAHAFSHSGAGADPIVSLGTHTVTGYVTISSSVSAGWLYGDGAGLYNLDASKLAFGWLNGDRIADKGIERTKLANSGCANGQVLKWDNTAINWICSDDNFGAGGGETDPLSVHNQETLQSNTTFYVSSGTVNYLTVNNNLDVFGTARIKGSPSSEGITVNSLGNVGVGTAAPAAKMDVAGEENPGAYIMIFRSGSKVGAWLRNK